MPRRKHFYVNAASVSSNQSREDLHRPVRSRRALPKEAVPILPTIRRTLEDPPFELQGGRPATTGTASSSRGRMRLGNNTHLWRLRWMIWGSASVHAPSLLVHAAYVYPWNYFKFFIYFFFKFLIPVTFVCFARGHGVSAVSMPCLWMEVLMLVDQFLVWRRKKTTRCGCRVLGRRDLAP